MANTVKSMANHAVVEVTNIDSDFDLCSYMGVHAVRMQAIQFDPTGDSDKCVVRDTTEGAPKIFSAYAGSSTDQKSRDYPDRIYYSPKLIYSEGTFTAGSSVMFFLRPE